MFNTNVVLSKTFRPILVSDQLPRSAADLTSHVCIQGGFFPIDRCLHLWREGLRELGGVDAIFLFRLVFALRLQGWHIFGYKKRGSSWRNMKLPQNCCLQCRRASATKVCLSCSIKACRTNTPNPIWIYSHQTAQQKTHTVIYSKGHAPKWSIISCLNHY